MRRVGRSDGPGCGGGAGFRGGAANETVGGAAALCATLLRNAKAARAPGGARAVLLRHQEQLPYVLPPFRVSAEPMLALCWPCASPMC